MIDYRPALHFSAASTWLNDPNGPVWFQGRAHVFFQNNPFGSEWGHMSWGHASSVDLTHWTHHRVAIPCDENEQIFSGCVVHDVDNTSGFGQPGQAPLVAVYTSNFLAPGPHGQQAQSLAYSLDGENWVKYAGNPVLARGSDNFRDPKVFRHVDSEGERWILVAVEATQNKCVFYSSGNLRDWTYLSSFGPAHARSVAWECPDLFRLPVEDEDGESAWVLVVSINPGGLTGGSGTQYFLGDFDGKTFTPYALRPEGLELAAYDWLDHGRDYYAATSWHAWPDERRVMIAWLNNWEYAAQTPTAPWRSALSLPRELTIGRVAGHDGAAGGNALVLRQRVAAEVTAGWNRGTPVPVLGSSHVAEEHEEAGEFLVGRCAVGRVVLDVDPGTTTSCGLTVLGGLRIGYTDGRVFVDRRDFGHVAFESSFACLVSAPVELTEGRLRLEVFLDRCSVEVFVGQGEVTLSQLVFPALEIPDVTFFAIEGEAEGSVRIDTPPLGPG